MKIRNRKRNAEEAVSQLSSIIINHYKNDQELIDSAARQLILIGKRHGVRAESNVTRLICRFCKKSLIPGTTARIRIYSGRKITTCIRCNRVYRSNL